MTLDLDALEQDWHLAVVTPGESPWRSDMRALIAEVRQCAAERVPEHQLLLKAERERDELQSELASAKASGFDAIKRMADQRDEALAALEWIACNVSHASGNYKGCLDGARIVELARTVVKARREEE